MRKALAPVWRDLTAYERDVLVVLALDGPSSASHVHQRLRGGRETSTESTTIRNVQSLAEEGLIERKHVDGRTKENSLTKDGEHAIQSGLIGPAERIVGGDL